MLNVRRAMHGNATIACNRARTDASATATPWLFAIKTYGERPLGAPPS